MLTADTIVMWYLLYSVANLNFVLPRSDAKIRSPHSPLWMRGHAARHASIWDWPGFQVDAVALLGYTDSRDMQFTW